MREADRNLSGWLKTPFALQLWNELYAAILSSREYSSREYYESLDLDHAADLADDALAYTFARRHPEDYHD